MKKYCALIGTKKYTFDTLKTALAYADQAGLGTIYKIIIADNGKQKYIPLEATRIPNLKAGE